jgi:hypothetical protein
MYKQQPERTRKPRERGHAPSEKHDATKRTANDLVYARTSLHAEMRGNGLAFYFINKNHMVRQSLIAFPK